MSGSIAIVPGYLPADGEKMTNAKFRQMASPVGQISPGQVTATELSTTVNMQLAALTSAIVSVVAKSSTWTVNTTDRGTLFDVTAGASDVTSVLPAAATAGNGWYIWLRKADTAAGRVLTLPVVVPNPVVLGVQDQRALVYTDGTSYYSITFLTTRDANGNLVISSAGALGLLAASGVIQIGGSTASFPGLKATGGTNLAIRAADDSSDASVTLKNLAASGRVSNTTDIPLTISSNTVTVDWSLGNSFYLTLGSTAASTITQVNSSNGQTIVMYIAQDGSGSRTFSGWSGVKWTGASAPTMTSTANRIDIYTLKQVNGVIVGAALQNLG